MPIRFNHARHATMHFSMLLAATNFPAMARAADQFASSTLPDTLVVKISILPDGTRGEVEAVTPVSATLAIDSPEAAKKIAGLADNTEQDALEECRKDIESALADLRRVARSPSRSEVAFTTRHIAKACNIPCALKQEFGVSCHEVSTVNDATWLFRRHFDNYTITGQGQYANINLPVYGIFTNSYNPYGNIYFPFTNTPWTWYEGPYVYLFYQRRR